MPQSSHYKFDEIKEKIESNKELKERVLRELEVGEEEFLAVTLKSGMSKLCYMRGNLIERLTKKRYIGTFFFGNNIYVAV